MFRATLSATIMAAAVLSASSTMAGKEAPPLASVTPTVTLPIDDYLELSRRAEEETERQRQDLPEPAVSALTRFELSATLEANGDLVLLTTYGIERRGQPASAVTLPVIGIAEHVTFAPTDDVTLARGDDGSLTLIAVGEGDYTVTITARAQLGEAGGSLDLPALDAAVARASFDLPVDIEWSLDGAVTLVDQQVMHAGGDTRRHLELALDREHAAQLSLRPEIDTSAAERLLARADVITIIEQDDRRSTRSELIAYRVERGELSTFGVTLPDAMTVSRALTDEGEAPLPAPDSDHWRIERQQLLDTDGWLRLIGRPMPTAEALPLDPVQPTIPTDRRFLVLATSVAGGFAPRPAASWLQVDLDDLPIAVRDDIAALGPSAIWRQLAPAADLRLVFEPSPAVEPRGPIIRQRSTTTLMTLDGAQVHRDRISLEHADSAFSMRLPSGVELWSTTVDGDAVRPLMQDDRLIVPLTYQQGANADIEVISRGIGPLPDGRGSMRLTAPRVDTPVVRHDWRLLLPTDRRYRVADSTLTLSIAGSATRRASESKVSSHTSSWTAVGMAGSGIIGRVGDEDDDALPGVTITIVSTNDQPIAASPIISNASGQFRVPALPPGDYLVTAALDGFNSVQTRVRVSVGYPTEMRIRLPIGYITEEIVVTGSTNDAGPSKRQLERWAMEKRAKSAFSDVAEEMAAGIASGVKPLRIELPDSGKVLQLGGILPPSEVAVELEVRPGR